MAATFRYFPTWTQATLETHLAKLLLRQAQGKTVTSVNAGDGGSTKQVEISTDEVLRRVRHDLQILDPTSYPASANRRVTRTTGIFRDS